MAGLSMQEIIIDIMRDTGTTQAELAKSLGISRQAVNIILHRKGMQMSTAVDMLTALGYELSITKKPKTKR